MNSARVHGRDHSETTDLKRHTDSEPPMDSDLITAAVFDDLRIQQQIAPICCDPDESANALYSSYRSILTASMKPLQVSSLNRVTFTKRANRVILGDNPDKQESRIAVRLAYVPNRSKGLRVLSFSNDHDYRRRSKQGYEKPLDHRLLRQDRSLARRFVEHSESLGLKVQFYSKHDGLIMSAQGSYTVDKESCMVVVEIATGSTEHALFRHYSHQ